MLKKLIVIFSALMFFIFPCSGLESKEPDFDTTGSIKSYFIVVDSPAIIGDMQDNDNSLDGIIQNGLRLKFVWNPAHSVRGELAYDLKPTIQGGNKPLLLSGIPDAESLSYRVTDVDRTIYSSDTDEDGNFILSQNLDRVYLTMSPGFGDIYIGRQPVAFGSARVINPTDVIIPYTFDELDVENRIGVDAVRVKIPIGTMSEFDTGIVLGKDFEREESAAFVRTKLYAAETDITLMVMDFKDNLLGGVDIARSIGGAGFWLETAYTFAGMFDDRQKDQDFFRISTGIDYHFNIAGGVTAYLEYHYNGASEGEPEKYFDQTDETAYREAGVYLLGRHYIAPGITWQIKPLVTLGGSLLWNVEDDSAYISTKVEYNLSENVYVGIGASIAAGEEPVLVEDETSGDETSVPRSEFGLYSDLYYTYIRVYF